MQVALSEAQRAALANAFPQRSRLYSQSAASRAVAPIAWTGFGSAAALLYSDDASLSLDNVTLSARGAGSVQKEELATGLPPATLKTLVAPPLAGRTCTALITTAGAFICPRSGGRTGAQSRDQRHWTPPGGETIRAVAQSSTGDIYLATALDGGPITVWDTSVARVAQFSELTAKAGRGVGFAVQRHGGDLSFFVWERDRLSWRAGALTGQETVVELPGLVEPAATWSERLTTELVAWVGWREAATGIYPVVLSGDRAKFGALILGNGGPMVVYYGDGRPRALVAGTESISLIVEDSGLKAVRSRGGAQIAARNEALSPSMVFAGLSSGNFLSLSSHAMNSDIVILTGWSIRGASIMRVFDAELRAPRDPGDAGADRALLQSRSELPPLEIDDGIALALQQGAGNLSRLRVWCEFEAFQPAGGS